MNAVFSAAQLGASVRLARLRTNMTQADAAERAGVERQWLNRFETGKMANPSLDRVLGLMRILNLELVVTEASADAEALPLSDGHFTDPRS